MTANVWKTTTTREILQVRAKLTATIHDYFKKLKVLHVDTPALSYSANTDPNIDSFIVHEKLNFVEQSNLFLHTSPEFHMKRLLASGLGSIYQICKVYRSGESGRYHNSEFTLLEWYRLDLNHFALMNEMELLFDNINTQFPFYETVYKKNYQELFLEYINIDPLNTTAADLIDYITNNVEASIHNIESFTHDDLCDYLMSHVIQHKMPDKSLLFIYDYPASQSSLAKLNEDGLTARRFEVFASGIELANGFHELQDAQEQRERFLKEQQTRRDDNNDVNPIDENLLQALESGLPNCSGVALGIERLLMLLVNAKHINEVLTFPIERA